MTSCGTGRFKSSRLRAERVVLRTSSAEKSKGVGIYLLWRGLRVVLLWVRRRAGGDPLIEWLSVRDSVQDDALVKRQTVHVHVVDRSRRIGCAKGDSE